MLKRNDILPEARLPQTVELVERGRELARTNRVEPGPFLKYHGVASEADFKRSCAASGRIMQHAQMGFRDADLSCRAWAEIYETCAERGVPVDRYGISLDWIMGLPRDKRKGVPKGTGLILDTPEEFVKLAHSGPVAPHFGDFIMGFPAAIENTMAALAAGATAIGNLGQFYTFRLPYWDDDIACAEATLTAIALLAAQPVEVLVHSNLDDGFAGLYTDLSSVLGTVLVEKHVIGGLLGAKLSHCWGHHFTDPLRRLAFHMALTRNSDSPGTMVYGNTRGYVGGEGANFASLASYLLTDIIGQRVCPSGHAVNPVPVTENIRIPDSDEIIEAQCFAHRMVERAEHFAPLVDVSKAEALSYDIEEGAKRFKDNVISGLAAAGIDTDDAFEMMLSLRRLGARRIERMFGAGEEGADAYLVRKPIVQAPVVEETQHMAADQLSRIKRADRDAVRGKKLKVVTASSDVHEHGKMVLDRVLGELGLDVVDGGISVDPDDLARSALNAGAEAILVSTYNGIALDYLASLRVALDRVGLNVPVLIGGRLNQVPQGSNSSLPVDVTDDLVKAGAIVCREVADAVPALISLRGRQ